MRNSAPCDVTNRVPGVGFCGTADDLARFAIAIETGVLLKPEIVAMMFRPQTTNDGKTTGYGAGWSVESGLDGNRAEASHPGQLPRVSNVLLIRPEEPSGRRDPVEPGSPRGSAAGPRPQGR